jgi:hypothetical protein
MYMLNPKEEKSACKVSQNLSVFSLEFRFSLPPNPAAASSDSVDVELQSARCLFGEKVKELSVAVAKVDALTRQLEELRNGNTSNSYQVVAGNLSNSVKVSQEYEKLRKELLVSVSFPNHYLIPFDRLCHPSSIVIS